MTSSLFACVDFLFFYFCVVLVMDGVEIGDDFITYQLLLYRPCVESCLFVSILPILFFFFSSFRSTLSCK